MNIKNLIWLSLAFYFLVVLINPGFMGTDEYWTGITRYIPAQKADIQHLVTLEDVKSPVQILPMHGTAQLALALGIEAPFSQYHFVVIVLGFLNFLILLSSFIAWSREFPETEQRILFLLLIFYFAAPFVFSRPMFESLSAPWLSWAALLAYRYDHKKQVSDLLWGVAAVSISFMLRPQTGLCALVFIFMPLFHRRYADVFKAAALGLFLVVLSGFPDLWLRGSWNFSIRSLAQYNFQHDHEYGNQPWTFYPLMLLAMTFAPLLAHRVSRSWFRQYATQFRSIFVMLFLFIFLHSLFSQKFERFLIPILPLVLILLTPWIASLLIHGHMKRLALVGALNGVLWLAASLQPAQNNIILMARYLDKHPEIKTIFRVNQVPEWIPEAFIRNSQFHFFDVKESELSKIALTCSDRVVLAEALQNQPQILAKPWVLEAQFSVNWIEWLSYQLNPKNNLRRTELGLWTPTGCEG